MKCLNCNKEFTEKYSKYSDGRFCSKLCARGFSTKLKREEINKKVSEKLKKEQKYCRVCNKEIENRNKSGLCFEHLYPNKTKKVKENYIEKWLLNGIKGRPRKKIRDFLLLEQNNKCSICGMIPEWNGNILVFVCDHINGDSKNNSRENLRMICPNCDSQTPTFKSKNKGKGRKYDREYRLKYYHKNKEGMSAATDASP